MFHRPAEIRRLVEDIAPRSVHVEAKGNLPVSFEVSAEGEGAALGTPFFETDGELRETPSSFVSSGTAALETDRRDELHEVRLVDDGSTIEAKHAVPVGSDLAALLSSHEGVRSAVGSFLASFSPALGSAVDAEVTSHESGTVGSGDRKVEADYTVRLDGVEGVARTRRGGLGIDEASVTVSGGDGTEVRWGFDVRNHARLFSEAVDADGYSRSELREARRCSGFAQEVDWSAENTRAGVSIGAEYVSENAESYLEELRDRGVATPARTSYGFEYDSRAEKTSMSFGSETDGDPTAGFRGRLDSWTGFLPLPVASLVAYIP